MDHWRVTLSERKVDLGSGRQAGYEVIGSGRPLLYFTAARRERSDTGSEARPWLTSSRCT